MASITLTIPTNVTARVVNAICTKYGYQAIINGSANPQTQQEFVRQWLITQLLNSVKEQEGNTVAAAAITTNNTDINNNIIIT